MVPRRRAARLSAEPRANIKGIQRGEIFMAPEASAAQFILPTSVNMNKTKLRLLGCRSFPSGTGTAAYPGLASASVSLTLAFANAVRADIIRTAGASQGSASITWELTEYP